MIPATHSTEEAATGVWDALVVGGGPAGAAAALRLARQGSKVLLVDRSEFPRPKVCGCCLSATAIRELSALEVPAGGLPEGVPLDVVRLAARGGDALIRMPHAATVSREALDAALVRAAIAARAAWLPALTVMAIDVSGRGVATVTARPADAGPIRLRARLVVIAAGLADAIRITPAAAPGNGRMRRMAASRRIGLGTTLPPEAAALPAGELLMAVGQGGYVGLVRLEDGRIDVAAAVAPKLVAATGTPATAIETLLADALGTANGVVSTSSLHAADVRATPPLTHHSPLTDGGSDTVVRIGDAAAYVEPFTGEGIGWALASARLFADASARAPGFAEVAARYRDDHVRLFTSQHARCLGVARAVRHPRLLAGAMRLARMSPRAAAGVLPWLVGGRRPA